MKAQFYYDAEDVRRLIAADLQAQGYAVSGAVLAVPDDLTIPVTVDAARRIAPVAPIEAPRTTVPMAATEAGSITETIEDDDDLRRRPSDVLKAELAERDRLAKEVWTPKNEDENLFTAARGVADPYRELQMGPPSVDTQKDRPRRVREIR